MIEAKGQEGKKSPDVCLTTMKGVASTLAVKIIVDHLKNGGTLSFPSVGITLTGKDLNPSGEKQPEQPRRFIGI